MSARILVSDGNVLFYLAKVQDQNKAAGAAATTQAYFVTPLSVADVDAALANIKSDNR